MDIETKTKGGEKEKSELEVREGPEEKKREGNKGKARSRCREIHMKQTC